ncbi:putative flagellar biosynthesis protein FlhB [Leptospira inadai serovar Lyme str. 10]|uniref:Putative flagellar biosynthesis protein FlhB n=1 Tax=Leptospira inadai serovar Lyme str. 10 TaxID=1049790 RepID=V6HWV9_9LEPT|nr:putative flagellar biosynthesis protein FlhB [Leptospira inadai serovar Lyme str. 10]
MKLGIALKFVPNLKSAPKVIATGEGFLADRIRQVAEHHKIPVVANAPLAEALSPLPVGEEIPENLYRAVAAVFAYLLGENAPSEM